MLTPSAPSVVQREMDPHLEGTAGLGKDMSALGNRGGFHVTLHWLFWWEINRIRSTKERKKERRERGREGGRKGKDKQSHLGTFAAYVGHLEQGS